MKRKGDLIFWEITDLQTNKEELEKLGFEDFVPRNDFKSAMIKALKIFTKGNEKLYRKFNDKQDTVNFGVFAEIATEDDLKFSKEIILSLDKIHGNVEIISDETGKAKEITKLFEENKDTIDASQFRSIILKVVRKECSGIPMRKGGGVYFIDEKFDTTREKLQKLFDAFSSNTKLFSIPIYDDKGTLNALEEMVGDDIFSDIESLINDVNDKFEKGLITKRVLDHRKQEAVQILDKIKVHEENLRTRAEAVTKRLNTVMKALNVVTKNVEKGIEDSESFLDLLKGI